MVHLVLLVLQDVLHAVLLLYVLLAAQGIIRMETVVLNALLLNIAPGVHQEPVLVHHLLQDALHVQVLHVQVVLQDITKMVIHVAHAVLLNTVLQEPVVLLRVVQTV